MMHSVRATVVASSVVLALAAQLGCSKDDKSDSTSAEPEESTQASEAKKGSEADKGVEKFAATSDEIETPKLLAIKFHHDS